MRGRYSYLGGGIPLGTAHSSAERRAFARAAQFAAEDSETVADRLVAMGPPPGWSWAVTWEVEAKRIAGVVVRRAKAA